MTKEEIYAIPQIKLTYVSDCKPKEKTRCSSESAKMFRQFFDDGEIDYRESFKVMFLNRANRILGIQNISDGATDMCIVDKKMVFSAALLSNATSIILCHNHPSGNLTPSIHDDKLTDQIKNGAELLGMKVLDHIILTRESFYSYCDNGKI